MTSCSRCGNEEVSSKLLICKVCGKEGCKNCMTYLFSFFQYGIEPQFHEIWYSHSSQCYDLFAKKMEDNITIEIFDRDKFGAGLLRGVFHNTIKNPKTRYWLTAYVSPSLSLDDFLFTNVNFELGTRIEKSGNDLLEKC